MGTKIRKGERKVYKFLMSLLNEGTVISGRGNRKGDIGEPGELKARRAGDMAGS